MKTLKTVLFILIAAVGMSQQNYTISGYVKDAKTGESLIGSTVYCKKLNLGTTTNVYGFYSITIPEGNYELVYSFIGFEPFTKTVEVKSNLSISPEMTEETSQLNEVIVSSKKLDKNVRSAQMGVVKINPKEISAIPVVFGEQDVLKTIQLLPGVRAGNEGGIGFHVRGGGADQNLILLDEAPVYNSGHLLGFFSVFNSDAINDFTLYKGNAPAKYGGRLSSVLDVSMKEGNSKKMKVAGGIGLISSRLSVEAPIIKDKCSFMISGRRTYADLFLQFSDKKALRNTSLYFYDLNAKANYKISDNDRIFISGYFGHDVFKMVQVNNSGMRMNFGNATASARWNHVFRNKKLFSNTTLIYSKYNYMVGVGTKNIASTIQDYNFKEDFSYFANPKNSMKFGFNLLHHTMKPGEITEEGTTNTTTYKDKIAMEGGAYISHDTKLGDRVGVEYGVRYSMFSFLGPGKVFSYNKQGEVTDSATYAKNKVIKNYGGIEPRITANVMLNESSSVKASYSRNRQYIHLVSNSTSTSNFDVWQPSTNNVKPEISDQYVLGFFKNFNSNQIESSVEAYYKDLQNQIEYRDGSNVLFSSNVESEYVYGKGKAYGLECYVKKNSGRLTGWMSYTLGRTERSFSQINKGKAFPARYDRTHDFSIVAIYQLSERVSVSGSWVYYTGNAVTFPSGKYFIQGITTPLYSSRNAHRMPDYHRLDLGLTLEGKNNKKKNYKSSWNFSIYNAYARQNPHSINFMQDEVNPNKTKAVQTSMFSIVPSVTYNFEF